MLIRLDGHLILWEGGIHHAGIEDLLSAIMEGSAEALRCKAGREVSENRLRSSFLRTDRRSARVDRPVVPVVKT